MHGKKEEEGRTGTMGGRGQAVVRQAEGVEPGVACCLLNSGEYDEHAQVERGVAARAPVCGGAAGVRRGGGCAGGGGTKMTYQHSQMTASRSPYVVEAEKHLDGKGNGHGEAGCKTVRETTPKR